MDPQAQVIGFSGGGYSPVFYEGVVAACGPKGLTVDENPFPAPRPVFVDGSGKALADLPAGPETITRP